MFPKKRKFGVKPTGKPAIDWAARRREAAAADAPPQIYGIHAVEAALANPNRKVKRAWLTENAENRLRPHLDLRQLEVERVTPRNLDNLLGAETVHQGALIEVLDLEEPSLKQLARNAKGKPLLVLDQVTDPHNVGAILRSAAVFGACGVVMTRRHSPPLAGALAKAASGALELIPIILVQNLARTLEDLKGVGFYLIGLDGDAPNMLEQLDWPDAVALVMGAEGRGLRELTRKTCNCLAQVMTDGPIKSLNVSNAAAIALHCSTLARHGILKPALT